MDFGLKGKRAIVMAASRGLGYASAMALAREGCRAVVVSEETGQISICAEGELYQALTPGVFRERLAQLLSERGREPDREREKEPLSDRTATKRLEA